MRLSYVLWIFFVQEKAWNVEWNIRISSIQHRSPCNSNSVDCGDGSRVFVLLIHKSQRQTKNRKLEFRTKSNANSTYTHHQIFKMITARKFTSLAADLDLNSSGPRPLPPTRIPTVKDRTVVVGQPCAVASKSRTRVSFYRDVRVITIPHINDFSDELIDLLWVSPDEFEMSFADCKALVRSSNELRLPQERSKQCCTEPPISNMLRQRVLPESLRGLEGYDRQHGSKIRARRDAAVDIILSEQSFQREEIDPDPEFLRQLYISISSSCLREAQARALQDRIDADAIYSLALKKSTAMSKRSDYYSTRSRLPRVRSLEQLNHRSRNFCERLRTPL